jgi:hypothetical protein
MLILSRKAHVTATLIPISPIPRDISFCQDHSSDYWRSGTIRLRTGPHEISTCKPNSDRTKRTFILYMTATEIADGLNKDDRIVINFDNDAVGTDKPITSN